VLDVADDGPGFEPETPEAPAASVSRSRSASSSGTWHASKWRIVPKVMHSCVCSCPATRRR